MTATKENFFNPAKVPRKDKAAATHSAATAIINAERAARIEKTERLKQLRLQRQAEASTNASGRSSVRKGRK